MNRRFRHAQWMHSIPRILIVALAFLGPMLATPFPSVHANGLCGSISSNTTWIPSGNPHIITCDVQVESGANLTIQPGVVVKFDGNYTLQIDGELIAQGTSGNPITFTSNAGTPAPGDWGYVLFTDTSVDASYDAWGDYQSGSIIQYAIIEYAGGASVTDNGALRINDSSPFIDHTIIRHSADSGIRIFVYSGAQKMTYNTITDNAERGIIASDIGLIEISHSTINNNSDGGLFIDGVTAATISHNTITDNSANDGGGIYVSLTTATISHNIIASNSADNGGGGIYGRYATLTINYNIIAHNSANNGGGVYVSDVYAGTTVSYNSILDNQASGNGAGIYATIADATDITNNTILYNAAGAAQGGVYISSHPDFNYNNVYDNTDYDLHNGNITPTVDLNAQDNWWGTTEPNQIDDHILDDDEDSGLGLVDYSSYLSSHRINAPISPPTGLTVTTVVTTISLVWSSNPESDRDGYKVHYDLDSGFPYSGTGATEGHSPIDVGNTTAFTLTGLPLTPHYYIAVTAYDNATDGTDDQTDGNESWYSDEEVVNILPEAPTLFPISNSDGDGDYLVDWNEVTGAITYTLQEDDNPGFTSPDVRYSGTATQYPVTGQVGGTWYYQVKASNGAGDSAWSNTESVNVIPEAPTLSPISNSDGDGDYLVDWNEVTGAITYTLQEDDNPGFTSPDVRYSGTATQYPVTGQVGGTWYYQVKASNGAGDSAWSNTESASVIPDAPVLYPISNPDGDGDYLVEWNDVTGAIINYILEEDDTSGFTSPLVRCSDLVTRHQVTGQAEGTWYYRVKASNGAGDSPGSNVRSVTVEPRIIYLPLAMKGYTSFFEGPWEVEPNDSYLQANGPLHPGRDYYGYPNDQRDFFGIYVRTGGDIIVDLSNHTGQGVQLQLFYQSVGNLLTYVYEPPYHIEYPGLAGWYYIHIYTESGYNQATPYTLRATFP